MTEPLKTPVSIEDLERLGFPRGLMVVRPAGVDLLMVGLRENSYLPEKITADPRLVEQATQRRELYKDVGQLFERLPDLNMNIDTAIEKGVVDPNDLARLYEKLTDFLETDENNARIILYLPFQTLPDFTIPVVHQETLRQAQERFKDRYKEAWIRLLYESDIRANFIDGDVLEPGLGEPPRVRKAGHLIPELLQRGIINTEGVVDLLEINSEDELLKSLAEGVVVAADRKLINDADWRKIETVAKSKPVIDHVISSYQDLKTKVVPETGENDLPNDQFLVTLLDNLETCWNELETKYASDSPYVATISHQRAIWEKQVRRDSMVNQAARKLAERIQAGKLSLLEMTEFCEKEGSDHLCTLTGLKSVFMIGEALAVSNFPQAQEIAKQYDSLIQRAWRSDSVEVKDTIISGLSHWEKLKIITEDTLKSFGVRTIDLSSPFPVDLEELLTRDLREIISAAKKIQDHPVLSEYVFPFFVVFGSRLKGYAGLKADLDLALFFKPSMAWEKREEVLQLIRQDLPELGDIDKVLEFWTEEKDGQYKFRFIPDDTRKIVGAPQVHFLFGGIWFGYGDDLQKLYQDTAERYLNLSRFEDQKDQVRTYLLRQIEMDILQVRLMHKGYQRFYPNTREKGSSISSLIDWESDFWDPGYRRIATQLFVSRVFLPDLSLNH